MSEKGNILHQFRPWVLVRESHDFMLKLGVLKEKQLTFSFLNSLYLSDRDNAGLHKFGMCCNHLENCVKYTRQLLGLIPTKPKIQKFWDENCGIVVLFIFLHFFSFEL